MHVNERYLNQLLQLVLHSLQSANVVPGDVGRLHHRFAQRRRAALGHGPTEVLHTHGQTIQHFGVDMILLQVDHLFTLKRSKQWFD